MASREAFATALRLHPGDPRLLAQLAWSLLESGDLPGARRTAEQALARNSREWLAWAVLARAARDLGDRAGSEPLARRAREVAPAGAHRVLDTLLP
jgi:predicted Zn-dependent protease